MGGGGQYFAFFDDGHDRQLPRLVKGPFKYKNYAFDHVKLSAPLAKGKYKKAVISPSMLYLTYPLTEEVEGYPKIEFVKDLVNECEKDIRGCFAAGASRVSIDFTEGRLACKNDSRNPWTGAGLLPTFIDLINQVLDRFTAEERGNIGLHTCPGGDCDSAHSAEVPYNALLPALFSVNAGYFLVQAASEADKDKETLYEEIGRRLRRDANGVKQVVFIGVVKTLNPRVETAEEICDALVAASRYIPKDQLGATDDCGFSPFASDSKPLHGGNPDFAREVALKKIAARVEGARMASEKLGI